MKLGATLVAGFMAFGLAVDATAGVPADFDADLVPTFWDVCESRPDGPNEACNQVDTNADGYGNACDPDYDDNGATTTTDFSIFLDAFVGVAPNPDTDHDCNGATTTADFVVFLEFFQDANRAPGPSGLACAGSIPCVP